MIVFLVSKLVRLGLRTGLSLSLGLGLSLGLSQSMSLLVQGNLHEPLLKGKNNGLARLVLGRRGFQPDPTQLSLVGQRAFQLRNRLTLSLQFGFDPPISLNGRSDLSMHLAKR